MVGIFKVGDKDKGFEQKNVTSKFHRLEKKINTYIGTYFDVYELYIVDNGNMYYRHHEEPVNTDNERYLGAIYPYTRIGRGQEARERFDKQYEYLINNGYVFTGIYECDICGYSKRVE